MSALNHEVFDMQATLAAALEGLEKSAVALREMAAQLYDGAAIADARAIAAEAQVLRMALMPRSDVLAIAAVVAAICDLSVDEILMARRDPARVTARQIIMYLARERGISGMEIARALRMDPATVAHGVRTVRERLAAREVAA